MKSNWSEITLSVGGKLAVPEQIWEFKASLDRTITETNIIWTIKVVAASEEEAQAAMSEVRKHLAAALLATPNQENNDGA